MATKTCPNGHQYDSSIYGDKCPFCPESSHTRVNPASEPTVAPAAASAAPTAAMYSPVLDAPTIPTAQFNSGAPGDGRTVIRGLSDGTANAMNPDGGRKLVGMLVSYSANPAGEVYKIYEGRNLIGRSPAADICFENDDKMSGNHLLILYVEAEGIYWAEDQKSSNGTYINGTFSRGLKELHTNDVIVLGSTKLVFLGIPEF